MDQRIYNLKPNPKEVMKQEQKPQTRNHRSNQPNRETERKWNPMTNPDVNPRWRKNWKGERIRSVCPSLWNKDNTSEEKGAIHTGLLSLSENAPGKKKNKKKIKTLTLVCHTMLWGCKEKKKRVLLKEEGGKKSAQVCQAWVEDKKIEKEKETSVCPSLWNKDIT